MKRLWAMLLTACLICSAPYCAALAEQTDLSWTKDTSPITFEMYIDYDWYAVDTWGKDEVSQYITQLTGVSLNVHKSSDRSELGVLLAADELPELIFTDNLVQRFEDSDICYAWDELIDQYAPDFWSVVGELDKINNTAADGHIYTFKTHFHYWTDPRDFPSYGDNGLYVREDVLNKLGMKSTDITSIEKLTEVFQLVDEKKGELGIDVVYNPHPTWGNAIADYMGAVTARWIDSDGKAHMQWSDPDYKDFLLYMNSLYTAGYLYKDAYAVRPEDFFALNRSGTVFAATYNTGVATETNEIFYKNGLEDKQFTSLLELSYNGEVRRKSYDSGIGWSSCFITRNCANPERAIKYMEFLRSPQGDAITQWGIEGKHYTMNDDGLVIRTPYYYEAIAKDPTSLGIGPWYFQGSGLGEGVVIASMMAQTNATEQQLAWSKPQYDLLKYLKSTYVSVPYWYFARVPSDSDEYTIQTKLTTYWNTKTKEVIMAPDAATAQVLYDEMMAYMNDNGLPELEAAMTANYQERLPLYADYIAAHPIQ